MTFDHLILAATTATFVFLTGYSHHHQRAERAETTVNQAVEPADRVGKVSPGANPIAICRAHPQHSAKEVRYDYRYSNRSSHTLSLCVIPVGPLYGCDTRVTTGIRQTSGWPGRAGNDSL